MQHELMCKWTAILLAQLEASELNRHDLTWLAKHFGLERFNKVTIHNFLDHFRDCPGVTKSTRDWADAAYRRLGMVTKPQPDDDTCCDVCCGGDTLHRRGGCRRPSATPWDLTRDLASPEQLLSQYRVADTWSRRPRPSLLKMEEEEEEDMNPRPTKRRRIVEEEEYSETFLDDDSWMAIVAIPVV
jgi:hypothetical protein